jgi:hypothetical protein
VPRFQLPKSYALRIRNRIWVQHPSIPETYLEIKLPRRLKARVTRFKQPLTTRTFLAFLLLHRPLAKVSRTFRHFSRLAVTSTFQ